jgi:hypothetical protein
VSENGDLTLYELTVRNGDSEFDGGGVKNWGSLTINYSTISGNSDGGISTLEGSSVYIYNSTVSGNSGGGIVNNRGSVIIENSTISGNYESDRGGGIRNYLGSIEIYNSTVSGNSATLEGGGIRNRGELLLVNSTISGNTVNGNGGGIWNSEGATLIHSTISRNEAIAGSGIYNYNSDRMELVNTIIGLQLSGQDCDGTPAISLGYNLDSDGTCNLIAIGDISGADPLLGPLQNNGGTTDTHALLVGSQAIDAIPVGDCTLSTDQRGVTRPQGTACDIGAFELEVSAEPSLVMGNGWFRSPAGAYIADPSLESYAIFAFVARYKQGANVPVGITKFMFNTGELNFQSSSYDWLVVTGSNYAKFKGSGMVNGELAPNGEEYKFKIWARDATPDTFRIKIWYEVDDSEVVVYDNGMDQEIEGGNIVIEIKE